MSVGSLYPRDWNHLPANAGKTASVRTETESPRFPRISNHSVKLLLGICFWVGPWSSRWAGPEGGEKGVAKAQFNLGVRYAEGNGVAKDATEAVKWYRKAAEQGDAAAQVNLGVCYAVGNGVAKDYVIAYMWANLAAASGENTTEFRGLLEKEMTPDQIAEAQRLVSHGRGHHPHCLQ